MIVQHNRWEDAYNFLVVNPEALGVTAPSDTGAAGYSLLHTCLAKQTPDWFMDYIFHRTPVCLCVGAHRCASTPGLKRVGAE